MKPLKSVSHRSHGSIFNKNYKKPCFAEKTFTYMFYSCLLLVLSMSSTNSSKAVFTLHSAFTVFLDKSRGFFSQSM